MVRYFLIAPHLTLMMAAPAAVADADLVVDGVPLPSDASAATVATSATDLQRRWSGVWTGAWNGGLKHILLVERIGEDGAAGIVYAVADNPYARYRRGGGDGMRSKISTISKPGVGLPIRTGRDLLRRQVDHALQDVADHRQMIALAGILPLEIGEIAVRDVEPLRQ
jgi:hypothetical protein